MGKNRQIRDAVREMYAKAARSVEENEGGCCCCSSRKTANPASRDLYSEEEAALVPEKAMRASLGCGNPTALAELHQGETILDLGSGGGIDVLLSARRVGSSGKVYGLDMTDEMLSLARENQQRAGIENVEFLKGTMEEIPLPDNSVDVVISNCVINLSTDKDRVAGEIFRVLRPGGRLAVTDIVLYRELPASLQRSLELWAGCLVGALQVDDYRARLEAAGFTDFSITPVKVYKREDLLEYRDFFQSAGPGLDIEAFDGAVMSAFVRAVKPK
ncbi:MAG: arsenite methyltransferase [Armatimonadetes bacterium]|nr:arsenite methyltransferase [Armatimonadota bacterium]